MRILRLPQVMDQTGLPCSTIYRLMNEGQFPKPIPLMKRCVGWLDNEINDWIQSRIALRDEKNLCLKEPA